MAIKNPKTERNITLQVDKMALILEPEDKVESSCESTLGTLANVSHELRTPLNAIINFSEILINGQHNKSKQEKYLKNIAVSGKHLLSLINDILDISKAESMSSIVTAGQRSCAYDNGMMQSSFQYFNPALVIKETVSMFENSLNQKNISLDLKLKNTVINSDIKLFRQIICNLLDNAIKYTPYNGKISIKSNVMNKFYRVSVKDTGIGIPEEEQEKIFSRFCQIRRNFHNSEKSLNLSQIKGTGLGLMLTKKLVESLKGKIGFESKENIGSDFRFSIPVND